MSNPGLERPRTLTVVLQMLSPGGVDTTGFVPRARLTLREGPRVVAFGRVVG